MSVYHVWQWTMSASRVSLAIARLRWKASRAPPKRGSVPCLASAHAPYPRTRRLGASTSWLPKQRTSTGTSRASSRLRYSTCTPAPPYTCGGYSLVKIATLSTDDTRTLLRLRRERGANGVDGPGRLTDTDKARRFEGRPGPTRPL